MGPFSFWQLLGYSHKARAEKTQNRVIQAQSVIGYYYSTMTICYEKYRQNCSGFYQGVMWAFRYAILWICIILLQYSEITVWYRASFKERL